MKEAQDWLMLVFSQDWLNVLLALFGFMMTILFVIAQFTPGDGFDWRSIVARRTFVNGRAFWTIDPGKLWQAGGFVFTTYGFVQLIGKGALSDLYLMVYAVAWLGAPGINQIVASKFPVQPGTVIQPEPEPKP